MSRTQGAFYSDVAHNGGLIHANALALQSINQAGTGALAFARNAAGDYQLTVPTGGTSRIVMSFGDNSLRRLIESYQTERAFQEPFNMGPPVPGRPPFTGFTQMTPPTQAGPPKGIQIDDVYLIYGVTGGANLTSVTPSLNKTVYAEGVAPVVTNIPLNGAALLTQTATQHIAIFTVAAPSFVVDDLSDLSIEWTIVVGAGTAIVKGAGAHCHFNYN
jgi:hypothetical protein